MRRVEDYLLKRLDKPYAAATRLLAHPNNMGLVGILFGVVALAQAGAESSDSGDALGPLAGVLVPELCLLGMVATAMIAWAAGLPAGDPRVARTKRRVVRIVMAFAAASVLLIASVLLALA